MVSTSLGRLQKVDLRQVWATEAGDFTPWLAREENLKLLGETLGLDLELEAQEKNVGPFRADLLCKDTVNNHWVLIENQIEKTDHTHLGQLITYAAGLKSVTIVWVAAKFNDEHRAALDWLNEVTSDEINFFGLEIELWRIGSSPVAPKFNLVSSPNDWAEGVSSAARAIEQKEITETKKAQYEYWQSFGNYLNSRKGTVRPTKALPQHWMTMAIGRTGFTLMAAVNSVEKRLFAGLVMSNDESKRFFHQLLREEEKIELEFGRPLEWRELPGKKESHIVIEKLNADPLDQSRWPEYHEWFYTTLNTFDKVFRQRVRGLKSTSYDSSFPLPDETGSEQSYLPDGDEEELA